MSETFSYSASITIRDFDTESASSHFLQYKHYVPRTSLDMEGQDFTVHPMVSVCMHACIHLYFYFFPFLYLFFSFLLSVLLFLLLFLLLLSFLLLPLIPLPSPPLSTSSSSTSFSFSSSSTSFSFSPSFTSSSSPPPLSSPPVLLFGLFFYLLFFYTLFFLFCCSSYFGTMSQSMLHTVNGLLYEYNCDVAENTIPCNNPWWRYSYNIVLVTMDYVHVCGETVILTW